MTDNIHLHVEDTYSQPDSVGIEENEHYYPLAQSHASNQLQKKITSKVVDEEEHIDLVGTGTIFFDDFRLHIKGYTELENSIHQSAAMLLDSLMITATQNGLQDTLVKLPLKKYMLMRRLKCAKEARVQVRRDIDALERVSFEYKGKGKQKDTWLRVYISGGTAGQIENGDIIFRFNQDFFDSFRVSVKNKYLYMYFPKEALQGNIRRHPHKYWLARKISEHKRMNIGKKNENILSVKTLVKSCPSLPKEEDVESSGRGFTQRIREPFERDMNEFNKSLSWHYINGKTPQTFKTFMCSSITIDWKDYPDTTQLETKKAKRAKKISAPKK
jgi:hypothetical protein